MNAIDTIKDVHPVEAVKNLQPVEQVRKLGRLKRLVPNAISSRAGRQLLHLDKASPQVLFYSGLGLGVATVVTACRSTLQVEEVLDNIQKDLKVTHEVVALERDDYTPRMAQRDRAVIFTKGAVTLTRLYAPSLVLGTLSVWALTSSHNILTRRNVALTAAYATLERGIAEYRQRVANELGVDRELELRYDAQKKTVVEETEEGPQKVKVKVPGPDAPSMYAVWFDEHSKSFNRDPLINRVFLQCQQNYANDMLKARGHVFLNEVYDMLGVPRTTAGQVVGWVVSKDGDNFIDFGMFSRNDSDSRVFINGYEDSILLDFNVDGIVHDKI